MPNNCLSVLYKRIIQVENKNVGLKVGGHKHTIAPQSKKCPLAPPPPPPPASYASVYIYQRCRKYSPAHQMRVKILTDELKNAAPSPTGDL